MIELLTAPTPPGTNLASLQFGPSPESSHQAQQLLTPLAPGQQLPIVIFMAYAHQDERLREKVEQQLTILRLQGLNITWYDSEITAGMEWENTNEDHLARADVILLLISSNFLASQYCYGIQVKQAVERHNEKKAHIIPIILHRCVWDRTPFAKIQPLPKGGKPISKWSNPHDALADIALGIRKAVEYLQNKL
ncbi:MAG TPA: toll/interleukin-1 receptor domain-containing protein [Ktedonosporobacter sp.]|nr:toll/interleukin-1 receptor domain-containing protein [Ktedonosporobacter sp.]